MSCNKLIGRGRFYPFLLSLILFCLYAGSLRATADWTILVYMAADNGLSDNALQDINDMESVTIPTNTNVIVQADFSEYNNPSGAFRYKINQDNSSAIGSQVLANLGEIDSGDWNSLKSFITWGFSQYPAEHKAVIIWSHGNSWYKDYDNKSICPDNTSENIMSVANGDLRNGLGSFPPLDILIFDACSMQSIEILSTIFDKAGYVIGSEDEVPVSGFPYQDMLPIWQGEPDSLVVKIPDLYVKSYLPGGSQNPYDYEVKVSCSTLDTSKYNHVSSRLARFCSDEIAVADTIFAARQNCYNLNLYDAEIDLVEFLRKAATLLSQEDVDNNVTPFLEAIEALCVAKAAINYDTDIGYLAIWFPGEQNTFNVWWQHYVKLRFMNSWLGLISAALGTDSGLPNKPSITDTSLLFDDLRIHWEIAPAPEFIRIKIKYIYSDPEFETIYLDFPWTLYGASDALLSLTLRDIKGSGRLYLQAEDYDGNLSGIDSMYVGWTQPKPKLIVYPNPCPQGRAIYFNWWTEANYTTGLDDDSVVRIYDIKGRLVDKILPMFKTQGSRKVDLSHLPCGLYIAKVKAGKKVLTAKFTLLN